MPPSSDVHRRQVVQMACKPTDQLASRLSKQLQRKDIMSTVKATLALIRQSVGARQNCCWIAQTGQPTRPSIARRKSIILCCWRSAPLFPQIEQCRSSLGGSFPGCCLANMRSYKPWGIAEVAVRPGTCSMWNCGIVDRAVGFDSI